MSKCLFHGPWGSVAVAVPSYQSDFGEPAGRCAFITSKASRFGQIHDVAAEAQLETLVAPWKPALLPTRTEEPDKT